jgi:hypothetical protein
MWLRGGIDGGHDKGNALIPVLKMGTRKMAAETSRACTCVGQFIAQRLLTNDQASLPLRL